MEKNPERCAIVIIGASGDLAKRKLVPALSALYGSGALPADVMVVGTGRSFFTDDDFRVRFSVTREFAGRLSYHQHISGLKKYLSEKGNFSRIIFFLAQPPEAYTATACELKNEGFGGEASLIIEKPFGYDLASAKQLDRELSACFNDAQLFRIDHYLAKEAVQNILVFRFANGLFGPIWNSRHIESIQISAIEDFGIYERGSYFDKAGIVRDMVQNHLLQLLSLVTMEPPSSLEAEDIGIQKTNVLRSMSVESCRRSQYNGYRNEKGVVPDSMTETFAELKLSINNERWAGTSVYIRTGKATHRKGTEIGIRLKPLPKLLFNEKGDLTANRIIFKIQPAEGIIIDLSSKIPGTDAAITGTHMNFCYREAFGSDIPDAYLRLMGDAIKGDRTLFVGAEETETAWKLLEPVLDQGELGHYDKGTIPASQLDAEWIDFEKYRSFCA